MIRRLAAELALAAIVLLVLVAVARAADPTREQVLCHYGLRDGGERRMFEDEREQLHRSMGECRATGARSCRLTGRDVVFTTLLDWREACSDVPPLRPR